MNYFDFNSKKYYIMILILCTLLLVLTIKAFDYLPEKNAIQQLKMENYAEDNSIAINKNELNTPRDINADPNKYKSGHIDFMKNSSENNDYSKYQNQNYSERRNYDEINNRNMNNFAEIKAPRSILQEDLPESNENTVTLTGEEKALKCLINAKDLKKDLNYSSALEELQKIPQLTKDNELNALSYEAIAEIYAAQKRYGTALTFANKANYLSPSPAREMLIARIYYKSGNSENAVSKMNSILNKGF